MKPTAVILLGFFALSGCKRDPVPLIWESSLKSPDGKWTALARTYQDGGFGSAYIGTEVELKRNDGTVREGKPVQVLDFDCPGPAARAYVLSDENRGGTIHLKMRWTDPSHLAVTYDGTATVNLQVVKLSDVNVALAVEHDAQVN